MRSATFETGISVISLHEKCLFSLNGLFITETIKYHPDSTYLPTSNDCGFFGVANVLYVRVKARGVGTGGARPPRFQKTQKVPFSGGKVPFAFVKNVVQIAFLTHGCCMLLECGAVEQ
jgi:hypothetical protein